MEHTMKNKQDLIKQIDLMQKEIEQLNAENRELSCRMDNDFRKSKLYAAMQHDINYAKEMEKLAEQKLEEQECAIARQSLKLNRIKSKGSIKTNISNEYESATHEIADLQGKIAARDKTIAYLQNVINSQIYCGEAVTGRAKNSFSPKEKGKAGRPCKIGNSIKEEARKMRREGYTIREIAALLGISVGYAQAFVKNIETEHQNKLKTSDSQKEQKENVNQGDRMKFENYKSEICHDLKRKGDMQFIISYLKADEVRKLYNQHQYIQCLYLLAMIDYLCRINNLPLCKEYDDIRACKIKQIVYPASVEIMYRVLNDEKILREARENSIPEFIQHNIVESEVRDIA
jgi:predicted transcriptional regulator